MTILIILIFIFIFLYHSHNLFFGNWQSTEEFSSSGTEIFMNFSSNNCVRIVFVSNNQTVVYDGKMYFYTLDPRSLLMFNSCGRVKIDMPVDIMPSCLNYSYSPRGYLKLYNDKKNYGEFIKINS